MTQSEQGARSARDWFLTVRPWSFPASSMPVILALAYFFEAGREIVPLNALLALLSVLFLHAAGNLWSDVYDYKTGVDAHDTEGVRALALGRFSVNDYLGLAAALLAFGLLLALWLAARLGYDLLWASAAGVAAGLFYPPLKYRAWGDVAIFAAYTVTPLLAMGRIVTGTWTLEAWPALLPTGILTVSILLANNVRDIATDARAGISTLAILLGEARAVKLLKAEYAAAFVLALACVATGLLPLTALATLIALLALAKPMKALKAREAGSRASLSRIDEASAQLQLGFSLLMTASLVAAGCVEVL